MPKRPPESKWKTAKVLGGTVSYKDGSRMGEVVKHLRARLKKAAREQKAKTAKLAAIPLPDWQKIIGTTWKRRSSAILRGLKQLSIAEPSRMPLTS
jgi:hypothetical protein